jgi:hypothetical protein
MSLYQIAVFANGSDSHADTLRATIQRSFSDLGIPSRMLSFLDEASVSARDHKSPIVSIYFGLKPHPAPAALGQDALESSLILSNDLPKLPNEPSF